MSGYLTITDLAARWKCKPKTVREDVVRRADFPKPLMPTGSARLRLWPETEIAKWEAKEGRKAA